jgi:NAD-dependent dihydropyrimidine dehydrogenase PreA subunit
MMGMSEPLSYRQIRVGEFSVGLIGLDEIFADLYTDGYASAAAPAREMLRRARQHNYIPVSAEEPYAEALLREYRQFCLRQVSAREPTADYGTWRGHPRGSIPWFPTVSMGRCDGCGACIRFCPNGVFGKRADQLEVIEPYKCQVGCDACARVCKPDAISFPPKDVLRAYT